MPDDSNASSHIVQEGAEAASFSNVKVLGDSPAFLQGLALGNAVSHQNRMNVIAEAATGKLVEMLIHTSPSEALHEISAGQIGLKGAQSTPPITAAAPVPGSGYVPPTPAPA